MYPAVQNLLIAATAEGLGTVLTTIATIDPAPLRDRLEMPDELVPLAVVPVGHPARAQGRSRRDPVSEVTSLERFGDEWPVRPSGPTAPG